VALMLHIVTFATTGITAVPSHQPLIYLGIWLIGEGVAKVHMISQLPLTKEGNTCTVVAMLTAVPSNQPLAHLGIWLIGEVVV